MNATIVRRPAAGEVRVETTAVGTMIAATIADVGSAAVGFVRGDRVVCPLSVGPGPIMSTDTLVGIPRNVTDRQAADLLAPGLLAFAMITHVRPFARGETVAVPLTNTTLRHVVKAWAAARGGVIVDDAFEADVVYDERARRDAAVEASQRQGRLQQAATEVFQAIRAGTFDDVRVPHRDTRQVAA